jgi:glycosyltransferase involved in cell wall biosynthesis
MMFSGQKEQKFRPPGGLIDLMTRARTVDIPKAIPMATPPEPSAFIYSVVIPVFNSEGVVGSTIDQIIEFFQANGWRHQIILVNDGSTDRSWSIIAERAAENANLVAINLLRNYGQHTATFCGLQHAKGDFVVTMDDDLQNPPSEIAVLVMKVLEGYDVVFGRFRRKQHAGYRRLGSRLIAQLNRRVFDQPDDLEVSNFRIISREVVVRMLNYQSSFPYITGLALMFSSRRANVWVEHRPRRSGKSTYGFSQLIALITRILFNYSAFPLHLMSAIGFGAASLAFIAGTYFLLRVLLFGSHVAGWASTIVLLSFFSGINIIIVSMLGEYVIRLVKQTSDRQPFHVKELIAPRE